MYVYCTCMTQLCRIVCICFGEGGGGLHPCSVVGMVGGIRTCGDC